MKKLFSLSAFVLLFLASILVFSKPTKIIAPAARFQADKDGFHSVEINKEVGEYSDRFDLSTPLDSFVTFKYLASKGKRGLFRSVNSYRIQGFFPWPDTPDSDMKKEARESILRTKIKEIIVFKDSVAGVITEYSEPMCIITYLSLENGKWLNAGEGLGNDLNAARAKFRENSPTFFRMIGRIQDLKTVRTQAASLADYLKDHGRAPKELILDALAHRRIVVYGELHNRKSSWDLLKTVIHDPRFVPSVGTIFMELSSDKQAELDTYFAAAELDSEIILDIFRDVQLNGWYDKGMFEFLIDVWKMNQKLSPGEKVRVVAVDEPRPFRSFTKPEELENHFKSILDRNEQMAKRISDTVSAQKDQRNHLFIVGEAHAFKSPAPGIGGRTKSAALPSAAARLSKIYSPEDVFSIFQHGPIIGNDGTIHGKIRNGLLDTAFGAAGNVPVAFLLRGSPVGPEPFDGIYEISYEEKTGSFENNYDAYLFLEPLESEREAYYLYEVITDAYVMELTRRAEMTKASVKRWFGVEDITAEAIISKLKSRYENRKRWAAIRDIP